MLKKVMFEKDYLQGYAYLVIKGKMKSDNNLIPLFEQIYKKVTELDLIVCLLATVRQGIITD